MNDADKNAPNPRLSIQEQDLNDAEKKVLHAFRYGWKEKNSTAPHIVSMGGGTSEGQSKKDWQGATLRGEFLRDLFLENYCKLDPREILIACAWIQGKLDLSHCESRLPVSFTNCVFSEGVWLVGATIPSLILMKCYVCDTKDVGRKSAAINAMYMKVTANVSLNEGFKAKGTVMLDGANIGGQLSCRGGYFEKGISAQNLKARGEVLLDKKFQAKEKVQLNNADIGGQLGCSGGYFEKGLHVQGLVTGKTVFLDEGFYAGGEVWMNGANIGGQLSCRGGYFKKGLTAQSVKTGESIFLNKENKAGGEVHIFKSDGQVRLNGADAGGPLICSGGHFENGIDAKHMSVKSALFLDGADIKGHVSLDGTEVGGEFRNMRNWSSDNSCSADGFRYQKIKNNDDGNNDWKAGLDWLKHLQKSDEGNFSPQPYQQLMKVYRSMGHTNWARKIGFELEKSRSKKFKRGELRWRVWYFILWATIGYGYKPFRFLGCAVMLLALGWFVFSIGHDGIISLPDKATPSFLKNEWIPSDVEAQIYLATSQEKGAVHYPPFNPFIYSLESIFPVLPLGQLEQWHPSNGWITGVRYCLTVIGSSLLAILALFGVGVLGPRWKGDDDSG